MAADPPVEDGRIAPAWQNQVAGRALRLARASMEGGASKQTAFVARLERELGISLSVGAYSNYENGRRTVPAAVLVEAAKISGRSLDDLVSEVRQPELVEWAAALGMSQRLTEIERSLGLLNQRFAEGQVPDVPAPTEQLQTSPGGRLTRVEREFERQGALLAEMLSALDRAGLWHPQAEDVSNRPARAEAKGRE